MCNKIQEADTAFHFSTSNSDLLLPAGRGVDGESEGKKERRKKATALVCELFNIKKIMCNNTRFV